MMDFQQKPTGMAETAHRKLIISLLSQSICIPDTFCWSLITRHNSAQYCTPSSDIKLTDISIREACTMLIYKCMWLQCSAAVLQSPACCNWDRRGRRYLKMKIIQRLSRGSETVVFQALAFCPEPSIIRSTHLQTFAWTRGYLWPVEAKTGKFWKIRRLKAHSGKTSYRSFLSDQFV